MRLKPGHYNIRMSKGYYAIQRKSDRALLPLRSDNRHTHAEFDDIGPPRLFTTPGGAKTSLRIWCKGIHRTAREWESINEYGEGHYIQGLPAPTGKRVRNPDDYRVVFVSLNILEVPA